MSCDLNLAKLKLFLLCLFSGILLRIGNALSSPYSLIWKYHTGDAVSMFLPKALKQCLRLLHAW